MKKILIFLLFFMSAYQAFAVEYQKVYFGKSIDLREWNSMIRLPFDQLLTAVQARVNVFRYRKGREIDPEANPALKGLPPAPGPLYALYKREIEMSQAVGIYMSVQLYEHYVQKPTLLLREDARHWTVIHEYTHHLFNEARAAQNELLPADYKNKYGDHLETLQDSYRHYEKNGFQFKDKAHLDEFILCLKVSADLRLKMLLQFELEEVAVESMIARHYGQNSKNPNADPEYAQNSKSYIRSNLNSALKNIDGFTELLELGIDHVDPGAPDFVDLKTALMRFRTVRQQIENYLSSIR